MRPRYFRQRQQNAQLLNSTTLELISIHYLTSNQIEFIVRNKLLQKNVKLNTIIPNLLTEFMLSCPFAEAKVCIFPGM